MLKKLITAVVFAMVFSTAAFAQTYPSPTYNVITGKAEPILPFLAGFIDASKFAGVDITGATDSTAGINTALTAALAANKTLYFPCGIYKVSGSGTEVFLVTNNALNLLGENNNCTYFNLSGVGSTTVVWHQVLAGAITGSSIQNISINVGGGQNFYKLDGGATGYIQHLNIHDFIGGTSFAGPVISLNATSGNPSGAIAYSTIYNNIFNSFYCAYCGDGVDVTNNIFGGTLPGIEMSFVSGAAGASITKNVIGNSGGQLILHNGVGVTIWHNEFEASVADTSPNNAIIDLQGDISQILNADFKDNSVSVLLGAGSPGPDAVRVNSADNVHFAGGRISLYAGTGSSYHIRLTASSTNTDIAQTGIRFETIIGSGTAMRIFDAAGHTSICSPLFSAPSNTTVLHGDPTFGCGAFRTVALFDQAPLAANSVMGNNTGSPTAPIALTVAQVKTLLAIVRADVTDWGAGVQTALGINVGAAGAFVTNGGALGTPSSGSAANLTGLPLTGLASQAANTILGNATAGSAAPTALAAPSCSTSASALNYTTSTGFTCNTAVAASTVTTNANLTGPVTSVGNATAVTNNAITNAMAAQMATLTIKGNNTGGTANALDLTVANVNAMINSSVAPVFANNTAKPTTVAGYGITDAVTPTTLSNNTLPASVTTLAASAAVTLSPASAAVAISPTGTGTVAISPVGALTVNPTAASTINNASIGATTASTGAFTKLTMAGAAPTGTTGSCAASSFVGGTLAGKFSAAVCAAGTFILSGLPAAANGYVCNAQDQTTPADTLKQTANTTTSVTFNATTVAADAVVYSCVAF